MEISPILCLQVCANLFFTDCPKEDLVCERDKLGFDAIKTLHQKIDDDKDGKVDLSESDEVRTRL